MRQLSCQKSTLPPADVADRDYMHISANAVNFDAARMCRQISTHGATQTDSVFFHLILKLYVKLAPGGFRSQHLFACLLLAQMQSISTRRADVQTDLDTRGYLDRLCVSSSDSHIIMSNWAPVDFAASIISANVVDFKVQRGCKYLVSVKFLHRKLIYNINYIKQ